MQKINASSSECLFTSRRLNTGKSSVHTISTRESRITHIRFKVADAGASADKIGIVASIEKVRVKLMVSPKNWSLVTRILVLQIPWSPNKNARSRKPKAIVGRKNRSKVKVIPIVWRSQDYLSWKEKSLLMVASTWRRSSVWDIVCDKIREEKTGRFSIMTTLLRIHVCKFVSSWLEMSSRCFIMPLYASDLAPCDFYLFPKFKTAMHH